jgi:hypothetical protein
VVRNDEETDAVTAHELVLGACGANALRAFRIVELTHSVAAFNGERRRRVSP